MSQAESYRGLSRKEEASPRGKVLYLNNDVRLNS